MEQSVRTTKTHVNFSLIFKVEIAGNTERLSYNITISKVEPVNN